MENEVDLLMVNIGSLSTGGHVSSVKADLAKITLTQPICTEVGEKRNIGDKLEGGRGREMGSYNKENDGHCFFFHLFQTKCDV